MRWLLPLLSVLAFAAAIAFVTRNPVQSLHPASQQAPQIEADQKPDRSIQNQQQANNLTQDSRPSVPVLPRATGTDDSAYHATRSDDEGTEFWPSFLGVRLKITDSLLVLVTLALAVFTYRLWRSTEKLWTESRFQSGHTERALIATERAFVFGKGFTPGISTQSAPNGGYHIDFYLPFVTFENVGNTPATDVRVWIKVETHPMNEDRNITFEPTPRGPATVLGPRSTNQSDFAAIPLISMLENWRFETEILIWSRVEYRDIFDPATLHHHEQSARIQLLHEPSTVPPPNHPPYVKFEIYGPQNTAA